MARGAVALAAAALAAPRADPRARDALIASPAAVRRTARSTARLPRATSPSPSFPTARTLAGRRGRGALAALAAVWLLFLPNAPYLVTDLVHIRPRPPVPATYDVLLFASFALAGCARSRGARSSSCTRGSRPRWGARAAAAVLVVLLLVGFGVYLGRFGRWNSWDLLLRPRAVLADAAGALADPRALAFTLLFAAFVGAGYLLLHPPRAAEADGERRYGAA